MTELDVFGEIFKRAEATDIAQSMRETVENSPWHREENTWVHTKMTLEAYDKNFAHMRTPRQQLLTKIALLFHDYGKPGAEETLYRDDGTDYRRYAGHELLSANYFVDFITSNPDLRYNLSKVKVAASDLRAIRYMVEHHLPYELKGPKQTLLKMNLIKQLGNDWIIFTDMVLSDCYGRISDDHDAKKKKSRDWCLGFHAIDAAVPAVPADDAPTMYVLVGTSGSGKSTFVNELGVQSFSLDSLRIDAFMISELDKVGNPAHTDEKTVYNTDSELYHAAFNYCFENPKIFNAIVDATFMQHIRAKKDFVLDNMNTSKKGRRKFIAQARQAGFKIVTVEFLVPLKTALERQQTRTDKSIPYHVVKSAYMKNQVPVLAGTYDRSGKPQDVEGSEIDEFKIIFSR